MKIAENAQNADIEATKRSDRYTLVWRAMALLASLVLAGGVIVGAIYLLKNDKNVAGFGILVAGIATMITAVLSRKKDQER